MGGFEPTRKKQLLKPKVDQLWLNFKTYFEEIWVNLCKLYRSMMKETTFIQKVSLIQKKVFESIEVERLTMTQEVKQTNDAIFQALYVITPVIDIDQQKALISDSDANLSLQPINGVSNPSKLQQ